MKDLDLLNFAQFGLRFSLVPSQSGYFTSEDCRIHYESFGSGPPVLLLHGGMGNATNWAHQVEFLVSRGYRAIVMDTRGHGRSSSGTTVFSYRVFAQDVFRLCEFLSLDEPIVVGWSDGACTALELARSHPNLVKGVVFFACNVDPTGTLEFRMTDRIANCVSRHEADFKAMSPGLERFEDLQPKLDPMQKNEPNYSRDDLRRISVPVVVIQGDQDEFIKREHAEYLANSVKNGWFQLLTGLGHFAPIQDPESFNTALVQGLKTIEGTAFRVTPGREGRS